MKTWKLCAVLPTLAVFLAACEPVPPARNSAARPALAPECGGPGQPTCQFFEGPFQLSTRSVRIASRDADFYPLARPLGFVDATNGRWVAQPGTLTDGASIPAIFIPVIGNPSAREFAHGAALHDAYCGIGNEKLPTYHSRDWRAVHRMFYDGLRVGGTDEIRAKIMYAAVYLGGPRWGDIGRDLSTGAVLRARNAIGFAETGGAALPGQAELEQAMRERGLAGPLTGTLTGPVTDSGPRFAENPAGGASFHAYERDLSGVPVARMRALLRETAGYIQTTRPTPRLSQIEAFMEKREARLLSRLVGPRAVEGYKGFPPSREVEPPREDDHGSYEGGDSEPGCTVDCYDPGIGL